jgi:signal transduction histidine kinase
MWISRKPNKRIFRGWWGYPACIILVALTTLLKYLAQPNIIASSNSLPYMLAIITVAIYYGLGPAILASILSVFAYNFFFVEPFNVIVIPWERDIPTLAIFLIIGIVVSFLASNLHHKNEEAEQLTKRLNNSQEEEKKRMARELHDDLSPMMAFLSLELDAIMESKPALSEEVTQRLKTVREKIDYTQQSIRNLSHELHPAILDNLGLEAALESLADEIKTKVGIEIEFNVSGTQIILSDEVNLVLYRVTQEALNNVFKHSRATRAAVNLKYAPHKIELTVADNGIGLLPFAEKKGGLGLISMKERTNLIGAKLRYESAADRGTIVSVEVDV